MLFSVARVLFNWTIFAFGVCWLKRNLWWDFNSWFISLFLFFPHDIEACSRTLRTFSSAVFRFLRASLVFVAEAGAGHTPVASLKTHRQRARTPSPSKWLTDFPNAKEDAPPPPPLPHHYGNSTRGSLVWRGKRANIKMPQLSGGGGDPELCATDEMIPFKDEGDPHKEQIFAELSHSEEEGDLADIKSSLVNESESSPNSNSHDVSTSKSVCVCARARARQNDEMCVPTLSSSREETVNLGQWGKNIYFIIKIKKVTFISNNIKKE